MTGVDKVSTFQMIPLIMAREMDHAAPDAPASERRRMADREPAAIIGFTSAIAAYGAFYIPRAYGSSIQATGTADAALWTFMAFYVSCAALTWWVYSGPRGALRDIERRRTTAGPSAVSQAT